MNPTKASELCKGGSRPPTCPVCKSEKAGRLFTVTAEESAQHFVLREADAARHHKLSAHIEELWHGNECAVWRCSECQFGFSYPYIAGDAAFYNLAYERSTYPHDKWEYRRTIEALEKDKFRGKRALEVGAGFGFFLDKIADKYVSRGGVMALEYDNASIEVLRNKGYRVVAEDILSASIVPGFDAIFLFQVVEHMDHLDSLFPRLSELAARGGRIFIAVPNGKHIDFQESSGSLLDMPPNHIGRWTRSAFEKAIAATGLEVNAIEVEPFSLRAFVREDIVFSYMRRAQSPGTLWNWSLAKRAKGRGRLLTTACALAASPLRIPTWLRAIRSGNGGASMWAELTRI